MAVSGSTSGRMTELQLSKSWRRDTSPDRTMVWTEPPKSDRRVPVVYYLSRNGQLEHPHFMEVHLSSSSPHGLFLRDVIGRLNVLRGKGMAAMYSWSCKRSYKNGFVWHDLSENDFIYPAHGHEYVLKGSELLETSFLDTPPGPPPPGSQTPAAERRRRNQSCSSIEYEYSVYKAEPAFRSAADASTQTDDGRRRRRRPAEEKGKEVTAQVRDEMEISIAISPPPSDSSPETLETLLKADGRPMTVAAPPLKEKVNKESTARAATKSSVLMQLISCGSVSFRDCGAGQVISQYRMRAPRGGRAKLEEKEYFSGSIVESNREELPRLKRCSSYSADRGVYSGGK